MASRDARIDRSSAEGRARSIIQHYGLRLPIEIDVEAIAALRGAYVREEALTGCEGRLVKKNAYGIISVKSDIAELGRKRFTIAHELGHFELHKADAEWMICVEKDLQPWAQSSPPKETEANMFAAELLMPESMFKPLCEQHQPNLSLIEKLANEFQTSLTATALRYVIFSPYRCAIVISRRNTIDWYKCTEEFGYILERGMKLDPDCFATDFFADKKLSADMQPVIASSWISSRRLTSFARLQEQSWGFRNYGYVLTLLWLDDHFEREEEEENEDDQ